MQPLYLMTNNNTLAFEDGGGGGSAIGAGALRYRDGKFAGSQAALIEEATTNWWPTPKTTGSVLVMGGINFGSVSVDTTLPRSGSHSTKVLPPSDRTGGGSRTLDMTPWNDGSPHSFALQASTRTPHSGWELADVFNRFSGVSRSLTVSSEWVDHAVLLSKGTGDLGSFRLDLRHEASADDIPVWIDLIQFEEKDHVTSLCPEFDASGNLLPGYAWTGTAHASASTRDAASITIPVDYDDVGSWACWYSEDMGQTWQFHYAELFGPIGDYGAIMPVPDTTTSVVDSARALLLGPLAIWADTLTEDEQAALENHGAMWTWDIASGNFPSGSRGPIHVIPAIPVIPATDVLPAIEVVAVAT